MIAAGGTGGHLYPAIALARAFTESPQGYRVVFVGSGRQLETTIVSHEGFPLESIDVKAMIGGGVVGALSSALRLPRALLQSFRLLRKWSATLVIGTGGYFSPPVIYAAALLGIRRVVLEPNAVPGLANRVAGPVADRIFVAFESAREYFARATVRVVGTPVRQEFVEGSAAPDNASDRLTLLVCGGSQGAHAINQAMVEAVRGSSFLQRTIRIIHQTGSADHPAVAQAYQALSVEAEVAPFLFDMPRAVRAADLVVSRSGAGTLAELAVCGKPSVLIPFPHATHGHQEQNAKIMEQAGAAVMIRQPEMTGPALAETIEQIMSDPERLRIMAERSLACRTVNATETMVRECEHLLATGT